MQRLVAEVLQKGDPVRGEAIFRRTDQACLKCHAIAGAGGQVGPDLVSIGASAPVDYLIDSILLPNKAIKENYHSLVVVTTQGQVYTGIKVRENKTELVMRNVEDREIVIPIRDIEERATGRSLMPDGLADPLTHAEFVDLVRFLSELGKVGPYSVAKTPVVRRWQVLDSTGATRKLHGSDIVKNDAGPTWIPAYSTVSGTLPFDELWSHATGPMTTAILRFQIEATSPGKTQLIWNSVKGIRLWLDQTSIVAAPRTTIDLGRGIHVLTVEVDRAPKGGSLRCSVENVAGSNAVVRIVLGK
jgi:putative heme-binding domain-containing protein